MVLTVPVSGTDLQALRASVRGQVHVPGDPGYDDSREIWNAMIDRQPALIVRCAAAADVVASLQFARQHDLPISVRGGGHNVSGNCLVDRGLTIDLSNMKSVRISPDTMTARVEPGVLWGEFDREAQSFGLATVGGTVASTGIAGLTLGGGFGWLSQKHGMTIDNLLCADVVTADGRLIHASADEHPDLFWALRGAGANFGVVTSFQYRLHRVGPKILGGMVLHPLDRATEVLKFYREFLADSPNELTTYAAILTTPDGHQVVALAVCYSGDIADGQRAVAPIREFGFPIADLIAPVPYLEQQALITRAMPDGRQNYWKSGLSRTITDDAIDVIAEYTRQVPSPHTVFVLAGNGGAVADVSPEATAFYHRSATFNAMALSAWEDPSDSFRNIVWTRDFHSALEPYLTGGVYVNDLNDRDDEGELRVRDAYGGNLNRLRTIKAKYDPDNVFRMNQNIKPAR